MSRLAWDSGFGGRSRAQRQKASKVCPAVGQMPYTLDSTSAQRQKASKVCPVFGTISPTARWSCSTPKGIKGMSRVIGHMSSTPAGPAQRQKASKVCPANSCHRATKNSKGAQRQKASKVCPASALDCSDSPLECSTPKGIKGMSSLQHFPLFLNRPVCSTPKGIKGMSRRL